MLAWRKQTSDRSASLHVSLSSPRLQRAPSTHSASLLVDSTSALGGRAGGGNVVNSTDPGSFGASSGSFFSANPPPTEAQRKREAREEEENTLALFNIARVVDGVVYGSKAYGTHDVGAAKKPSSSGSGSAAPTRADGTRIRDKFVGDEESMRHDASLLRKQVASVRSELLSLHRERELLEAHLEGQMGVLDAAARRKGFVRVSGGNVPDRSAGATTTIEKPRYEKISDVGLHSGSFGGVATGSAGGSAELSLEEQLLSLQVQHRSLLAQRKSLRSQLHAAEDLHGTLPPHAEDDLEAEKETKRVLLAEIHQLQTQMLADKRKQEQEKIKQEQLIAGQHTLSVESK